MVKAKTSTNHIRINGAVPVPSVAISYATASETIIKTAKMSIAEYPLILLVYMKPLL